MIDIESLRGPDVVELCLIALFVIVVSIDGFVGMSFDDRRKLDQEIRRPRTSARVASRLDNSASCTWPVSL